MNLQNLVDYCQEYGLPDPFSGASVPAPLNIDTVISAIMVRCGLQTPLYGEPDTFRNATTHWFLTKQWTFEHLINIIQAEYSPIENVFEVSNEKTQYGHNNTITGGYKDSEAGKDTEAHSGTDSVAHSGTDTETHSGIDTEAHSGTDTEAHSGTDSTSHSGTDTTTNEISAYNNTSYQPDNKSSTAHGHSIGLTHGESIGTTHGESISTTHGESIGTTYGHSIGTTHGENINTTYGHNVTRVYNAQKNQEGGIDEVIKNRHGNIGVTTNQHMIEEELELLRHFDIYGYIAEIFESDNMLMIY